MNELIKELTKQSKLDLYGFGKDRAKWEASVDEFAELIVQACIKELEITQRCDPYTGEVYDDAYNDALTDGIVNIKYTFGIK